MTRITTPTPQDRETAARRLSEVWAPELARRSDRDRLDRQADRTDRTTGDAR